MIKLVTSAFKKQFLCLRVAERKKLLIIHFAFDSVLICLFVFFTSVSISAPQVICLSHILFVKTSHCFLFTFSLFVLGLLSLSVSLHLSLSLSLSLSQSLYFSLSVSLSVCLSVCPSLSVSFSLSLILSFSFSLSHYLFLFLSLPSALCLSLTTTFCLCHPLSFSVYTLFISFCVFP
jgi:hypothetical protein